MCDMSGTLSVNITVGGGWECKCDIRGVCGISEGCTSEGVVSGGG